MSILQTIDLVKKYGSGDTAVTALDRINVLMHSARSFSVSINAWVFGIPDQAA